MLAALNIRLNRSRLFWLLVASLPPPVLAATLCRWDTRKLRAHT
jgi:hypothetical protein